MPDLLASRIVRVVVLVAALGVGGVAGAPVMTLPPRVGVTMSGGDDPDDDGGGGDDPPESPRGSGPGAEVDAGRIFATVA